MGNRPTSFVFITAVFFALANSLSASENRGHYEHDQFELISGAEVERHQSKLTDQSRKRFRRLNEFKNKHENEKQDTQNDPTLTTGGLHYNIDSATFYHQKNDLTDGSENNLEKMIEKEKQLEDEIAKLVEELSKIRNASSETPLSVGMTNITVSEPFNSSAIAPADNQSDSQKSEKSNAIINESQKSPIIKTRRLEIASTTSSRSEKNSSKILNLRSFLQEQNTNNKTNKQ